MTSLELQGVLISIGETKEYGKNNFKKRESILLIDGEYPVKLLVEFVQDKCNILDGFSLQDEVLVSVNLRSNDWKKKDGTVQLFNVIQGWKIQKFVQQKHAKYSI